MVLSPCLHFYQNIYGLKLKKLQKPLLSDRKSDYAVHKGVPSSPVYTCIDRPPDDTFHRFHTHRHAGTAHRSDLLDSLHIAQHAHIQLPYIFTYFYASARR